MGSPANNKASFVLLWLVFLSVICNQKVAIAGQEVYISCFAVCAFVFHEFGRDLLSGVMRKGPLVLAACVSALLGLGIVFNGPSVLNASDFVVNLFKLCLCLGFYAAMVSALRSQRLELSTALNSMILFLVCASVRYVGENIFTILIIDSEENRPYPEWIGGYNQFAALLAMGVVYAVYANFDKARKLVVICLCGLAMAITMSRGGVGSFVLGLAYSKALVQKKHAVYLVLLGVLGLFILLFSSFGPISAFKERYLLSLFDDNLVVVTSGRHILWGSALEGFFSSGSAATVLFGKGVGTFSYERFTDPHNTFLHIMWEFGLIGLLLLVGAIWFVYRRLSWHSSDEMVKGVKAMVVVLLINLFFEGFQYSTQTGWFAGFVFACAHYLGQEAVCGASNSDGVSVTLRRPLQV